MRSATLKADFLIPKADVTVDPRWSDPLGWAPLNAMLEEIA